MFKQLELFGSVFLWLIIFVKKQLKRCGRERVELMIKSHGKVTYCHGKVMEIHYYSISVGTLNSQPLILPYKFLPSTTYLRTWLQLLFYQSVRQLE